MARIIYSALVESIRGSIGGTTFQKNAYGYTVKKKPNIIKPNSVLQNQRKAGLAFAVKSWQGLTDAQRADWNSWASTYPQYAKHNPSSQLSGFAAFVKYHALTFLFQTYVRTAPSYTDPPNDIISYSLANSSGTLNLSIVSDTDDEAWDLLFFLSRPFNATQNFVGTKTRYIKTGTNIDNTIDITSEYSAVYGQVPATGSLIAVDMIQLGDDFPQVKARVSLVLTVG